MTTCLITGITGYIGKHLLQTLQENEEGISVFGLSSPGVTDPNGYQPLGIDLFNAELPHVLEDIQPDIIYHAVGVNRAESLQNQIHLHVEGTRHLLQSLADKKLSSRVIILGSAAEYGQYPQAVDEATAPQPVTDYGVAKLSQTLVAQLFSRKYHLPVIIARIFNVYGNSPPDFAIASLASKIAHQEMVEQSKSGYKAEIDAQSLASVRDFIHVNDVCKALMALADRGCPGEVYNVASGTATPLQTVMDELLKLSTLNDPIINANPPDPDLVDRDFSQALIDKIKTQTEWVPEMDLLTGLEAELNYWRQHYQDQVHV